MKLLTEEIKAKLPPLYSQEQVKDPIAQAKFFYPASSWTWFPIEYSPAEGLFFGLVCGHDDEMGYFSLSELESVRVGGLRVERDLHWTPRPLSRCKGS